MNFTAHDELQLFALLVALAACSSLPRAGGCRWRCCSSSAGCCSASCPGLPQSQLPPDLVLVAILPPLLYSAAFFTGLRDLRANLRPISLLAIGLVVSDDGRRRGRRARRDRRPDLGRGVHPRRDRLADRRARGDRGRPPVQRAAPARLDPRRREPRQRRHRARPLQDGRRGGRRRDVLALERVLAPRSSTSSAASPSVSPSATSSARCAGASTTRRPRSRSPCSPATSPTCPRPRSASPACSPR